jgi:hypothetical protein
MKIILIKILAFFIVGSTIACLFDFFTKDKLNFQRNITVGVVLSILFFFILKKKNSQN